MADGSQPAPVRMLAHGLLVDAYAAFVLIGTADQLAKEGRQADALGVLAKLAGATAPLLPVMRGVMRTQQQAAQALHLSQSPAVRVFASIGVARPDPHASNDEQPATSEQPSRPVA